MRKGMRLARGMASAILGVALGLGGVGESVAQGGMKKDGKSPMQGDRTMEKKQ